MSFSKKIECPGSIDFYKAYTMNSMEICKEKSDKKWIFPWKKYFFTL